MTLYAKLRAWFVWLFWFYIRFGKEMPRKKFYWTGLASFLWIYLGYEALIGDFSREPGWTYNKVVGYICLGTVPALILALYGHLFGHHHKLAPLDPAYTRPNPLEPIGISLGLVIIALAKWYDWW